MQIARLLAVLSVFLPVVSLAAPIALRESPPAQYTVVTGDTLWQISGRFLKNPWQWPRLWRMNRAEIRNPHWIYPGDVITLDRSGAEPRLVLHRPGDSRLPVTRLSPGMRALPMADDGIAAVSLSGIQPYLSRAMILEPGQEAVLPAVLAGAENHLLLAPGSRLYVSGLPAAVGSQWAVYHPGARLADPASRQPLGLEAAYAGSVRVVQSGEPAMVEITRADQEIVPGDRLLPLAAPRAAIPPHAPGQPLQAQVIRIMGGLAEAGPHQLVILDRGRLAGVEAGQVLSAMHPGAMIPATDRTGRRVLVDPGSRRTGLLYILSPSARAAIALVMEAPEPIQPGDLAQSPQEAGDS